MATAHGRIHIRLHTPRLQALRWWAQFWDVKLATVVAHALSELADEIIETYDRTDGTSPITTERAAEHIREAFNHGRLPGYGNR